MSGSKLKFKVIFCNSEEEKHLARELQIQEESRGWQTPKFCEYPVELGLQFEGGVANVTKINFLSHKYKIASRIELFFGIGEKHSSYSTIAWKRCGFLSLDSNQRTNYQANELKSVHVQFSANFIRMLVYKNHANSQNIYGQIGLLNITVFGSILPSLPTNLEKTTPKPSPIPPISSPAIYKSNYSEREEQTSLMDELLSLKIGELNEAKADAAEVEDYQLCNQLKKSIQKIRETNSEIVKLDQAKKAAVLREDYEQASQIKLLIDQKKIEALQFIPDYPGKDNSDLEYLLSISSGKKKRERAESAKNYNIINKEDEVRLEFIMKPYIPSNGDSTREHSLPSSSQSQERPKPPKQRDGILSKPENKLIDTTDIRKKDLGLRTDIKTPPKVEIPDDKPIKPNNVPISPQNHDDLPIPAIGNTKYKFEDIEGAYPPGYKRNQKSNEIIEGSQISSTIDFDPKELSEKLQKELSALIEMFGLQQITDLWSSSNWKEREEAIKKIEENLSANTSDVSLLLINGCKITEKSISDKIAGVFIAGLDFFKKLIIICIKAHVRKEFVRSSISGILQTLSDKLGDSNAKLRDQTADVCFFLAEQEIVGVSLIVNILTKKQKKPSNSWKLLVGKLDLLSRLIAAFGFGDGDKFVPKELAMSLILPCFENPNAEVRNSAVSATVECSKEDPKFVSKKITDIKPQIKEMLEMKLQASGSVKKFQVQENRPSKIESHGKKEEENQAICQFCLESNPLFINDENLDRHLVDECPLLTDCVCQQVIEISDLTSHLLTDTERHGNEISFCNKCGEAISKQNLKSHQEKQCKPMKDPNSFIRCPLCKLDIPKEDDESSWRNHLTFQCTKNPRRKE